MNEFRLAIIIPAYREAESVGSVVRAAKSYGTVLVVDDCSPDETAKRAEAAGAIVIRNERNLGYEATLSRGIAEVESIGFKHVVSIDADGEHDPALLEEFQHILLAEAIPLVLGVRDRTQRFAESVMGRYIQARFGVRDILCGMKGYNLDVLRPVCGTARAGDRIGTELAISALRYGFPYREVRVQGTARKDRPRFGGGLKPNLAILQALTAILREDVAHVFQDGASSDCGKPAVRPQGSTRD